MGKKNNTTKQQGSKSNLNGGNDNSSNDVPVEVLQWKQQKRDEHKEKQLLIVQNYVKTGELIEEANRINEAAREAANDITRE